MPISAWQPNTTYIPLTRVTDTNGSIQQFSANPWIADHTYFLNDLIFDGSHYQKVTGFTGSPPGTKSGATIPIWNHSGSTTTDGSVIWTDQGVATGVSGATPPVWATNFDGSTPDNGIVWQHSSLELVQLSRKPIGPAVLLPIDAVSISIGAGDAGKVVLLNASGQLDPSMGGGGGGGGGGTGAFNDITSGANISATMTVGSGAQITATGSGVIDSTEIQGVPVSPIAPSAGNLLIYDPILAEWVPGDPLVQGLYPEGHTATGVNPVLVAGKDSFGALADIPISYVGSPSEPAVDVNILAGTITVAQGTSSTSSSVATELGTAATYAILGSSAVTNTGATLITGGNVGSYPTNAITGLTGANFIAPAAVVLAVSQNQTDLNAAIVYYQGLSGSAIAASFGTTTFTATGATTVFTASSTLNFTGGTVTLDGAGFTNPVFVFQIGSALTVDTAITTVVLINGATAANVIWVVGSSATFDAHAHAFAGNILAVTSITLNGGSLTGRALANGGAVTISSATDVTVPIIAPAAVPWLMQDVVAEGFIGTLAGTVITVGSPAHPAINVTGNVNILGTTTEGTTSETPFLVVGGESNDTTAQYQPLPLGTGGRTVIVEGFTGGTAVPVSGTVSVSGSVAVSSITGTVPTRPASPTTASWLSTPISFSAVGANVIIAGVGGQTVRVMRIFFVNSSTTTATNITIQDTTPTSFTGAFLFITSGVFNGMASGEPIFISAVGQGIQLNSSIAVQISGTVWYTQS